jgi:hypothetical protein
MKSLFVIPLWYNGTNNYIQNLVDDIHRHHKNPNIVVVDSDSPDHSYVQDIHGKANIWLAKNKNYHVGAYWKAYFKFEKCKFFYFLHDSLRIKGNLDHLTEKPLTIHSWFHTSLSGGGDVAADHLRRYTDFEVTNDCEGITGCIFFCQRQIMDELHRRGMSKLLPNKTHHTTIEPDDPLPTYSLDGAYGRALTQIGFNLKECALHGDAHTKGPRWLNGVDGSHETLVEKLYGKRA